MEPVSLHFGPFHLDGADDGLWRGSEPCKLTAKAVAVLRYLVAHPGRLVRKPALLEAVWPDVIVSDWALTTCIHEIRYVLGDVAKTPRYIATVHRQGYRFIAPVTVADAPPPLSVPKVLPRPPLSASPEPEAPQSSPTAAALEEEHKLVTILCGALAEVPALAARLGPEGLYRLLQTVVGLAQGVLHHYAGSLTLVTSEGFTAVFGAPVAQEDHARRAVLAALELRQRLHDSPALRAQMSEGVLALSMGLHSGPVVVGRLGQDPQRLATAVGAPLQVATRLQQHAAPGTILVSAATYHLVHAEVRVAPYGTFTVDEPFPPVPLFAVQGPLRRHAGVVGWGPRAQSPFVGRERELALLHDHLAAAVGGQGQVVGLVGEPGMGKTRLLTEFCRRVAGNQVMVYEGSCLSYGQATPYLPVRDLVRELSGVVEGDETAGHTVAVQQRLHASGMTADDDVALLQQLLDLPVAPERLAQRSPEARQARTFALLRHLVLDAAQQQPLVLIVENLHWIDPTSEAWLASLVERLARAAVLILGTYRPGYQPPWGAHAVVTQVALPPLSAQTSRSVVDAVVGAVSLPEARLQTVVAQAGGNPFFLEELAWHAVEQGGLDTLGAVPETVQAVLAARFDRLPSEAKRLLQTAAVIGMQMTLPLLQAVTELSDAALHTGLTHLQAVELLYETRVVPELIYTFKHALIHEVAYGGLLQERRRELHARIVDAIETLHRDRLDGEIERLAHHALRAEMREKAVSYLRQAGVKATARSALQEARGWFEQALGVLEALPESSSTLGQGFEIRLELRPVLTQLGEGRRVLEHLREAEALAQRLNDDRRRGRVCAVVTNLHSLLGELDEALVTGTRALEIAGRLGDVRLHILTTNYLGQAHYLRGDYERTVKLATDNLAALPADWVYEHFGNSMPISIYDRYWLVRSLAQLGRFAEAAPYEAEALRLAEPTHHAFTIGLAHVAAGTLHLLKGDWAKARRLIERAIAELRRGNIVLSLPHAVAFSTWVLAQVGEASRALTRLREGEELLERQAARGFVDQHGGDYHSLGRAALRLGRLDEARSLGNRAVEYSPSHPGFAAHALHLLGDIATHPDRFDAESGEGHYRKSMVLAEPRGMRPLIAHCHLGLGKLYRRTGKHQQAREHLSTAMTMYREMDMRFWLEQAEAQIT